MKNKIVLGGIFVLMLFLIQHGKLFALDKKNPVNTKKSNTAGNASETGTANGNPGMHSGEQLFANPYGIGIDEARGFIYIADTGNNCIRKFNLYGDYIDAFGSYGTENGHFMLPQGVCVVPATGEIYVADTANCRIQKFDANYKHLLSFGSLGTGAEQFTLPRDVALDSKGQLYVCDGSNHRIVKYAANGTLLSFIGSYGTLFYPQGIDIDADDNLYVADSEHHRIAKFAPDGTLIDVFGSEGNGGGQFESPSDVAIDKQGCLYVADTSNARIQKLDSRGNFLKEIRENLHLVTPEKVVIDSRDMLYIVDSNANKFVRFNAATYITDVSVDPLAFSPDGDGYQEKAYIHYKIPESSKITITIYNQSGQLIRTLLDKAARISLDNKEEWDGKDNNGNVSAEGKYTFKIDAWNAANIQAPQVSGTLQIFLTKCRLSGIVSDGENPVYNVDVTIDGTRTATTDLDGYYSFKNLSSHMQKMVLSKPGYNTIEYIVVFDYDGQVVSDFDLLIDPEGPRLGTISGTVQDENGMPVTDASVTNDVLTTETD